MRLTSLAILFIIIIGPFLTISSIESRILQKDQELRAYYDQVVDNAVQDAVMVLTQQRRQMSDESGLTLQNTREIAAAHFFDSLYYSFGVYGDKSGMMRVKSCVPIIVFLERDGYVVYALNEYQGPEGYTIMDYCWYPEKAYSSVDASGRYYIRYTLEDAVIIYDVSSDQEMEGLFSDFASIIPQFQTREEFESARLIAVSQAIEKDLAGYIARFNAFSARIGVTYTFRFPRIEDADWIRALTDEGMLAFAQGFPVMTGAPYENNAFGGARILKKPELVGYEYEEKRIYCRDTCEHYLNRSSQPDFRQESLVRFTDAREAASHGYYPCEFCRP